MANLELPFGIKVLNQKPVDAKYLNDGVPYNNVAEANSLITSGIRHTGLTVNVLGVEYWYRDGITDPDLILKTVEGTVSGENVGVGAEIFSGATGSTSYYRRISGSGDTTVSQSGDTVVVHSVGGGSGVDEYTGATPSDIEVGHMQVGSILTGRSYTSLFQEILVQTNPTLTNPSNTFSFSPSQSSPQEVGSSATVDTIATFNQGSIDPVYSPGSTDKRSGLPNQYNYTGTGLPASVSSSSLTDDRPSFAYTVVLGSNTWTSTVSYDIGTQPYDVNGDPYDSPYPAGTTSPAKSLSFTGIYPWFYGSSVGAPVANQALIDSGTKLVQTSGSDISTGTMSFSSEYLWFAIPNTSTSKTIWQGSNSVSNTGNIGGVSDLLAAETVVSIDSPSAYWSGVSYKIYLGNYPTDANYYFTFKNS